MGVLKIKRISKVLIIVGIITLLIPMIGNGYIRYQQQKYYSAYEEKNKLLQQSFDELQNKQPLETFSLKEQGEIIGKISIPKIESEMLLIEGADKKELQVGAGHIIDTAMPGEIGNCAIAGHRSYTFAEMWNRLDEVEVGDEIYIVIGDKNYVYIVDEIFIVEPEDIWVLEPMEDKSIVTLITCEPVVKATHRLIVRGKLNKNEGEN